MESLTAERRRLGDELERATLKAREVCVIMPFLHPRSATTCITVGRRAGVSHSQGPARGLSSRANPLDHRVNTILHARSTTMCLHTSKAIMYHHVHASGNIVCTPCRASVDGGGGREAGGGGQGQLRRRTGAKRADDGSSGRGGQAKRMREAAEAALRDAATVGASQREDRLQAELVLAPFAHRTPDAYTRGSVSRRGSGVRRSCGRAHERTWQRYGQRRRR